MTTTKMDGDNQEVKNKPEETDTGNESQAASSSAQSYSKIGWFDVKNGDVVLRGRHGERDHIYPLHAAITRYEESQQMLFAQVRNGIRGWDTFADVIKDMRAKILEAIEQRRHLNLPIPQEALKFEQLHGDTKKVTVTVLDSSNTESTPK